MATVPTGPSKEHDVDALWDTTLNDFEASNDGLESSVGVELDLRLDNAMVQSNHVLN